MPRRLPHASLFVLLIATLLVLPAIAAADETRDYRAHPEFNAFAKRLVTQHGFTRDDLETIFDGVARQQKIIDLITRPAESKAWHEYRPIFITDSRIEGGVDFWQEHRDILARAEHEFGVDADVIIAVIGIETFYGRISGSWRVIDALATLGFDYPPRSRFFVSELENFLLLTREEAIDPNTVTGSYAGAMGGGQFMPSSYRAYAVDFDGDGKRDLWDSWADVIGSVANYLSRHGWQHGQAIALPAALPEKATAPLQNQGMAKFRAAELRNKGLVFSDGVHNQAQVRLVALQQEQGMDYWIGLHNFGVLNRYNRSPLYAMAVVDLARAIRSRDSD